jgi:hypothetical protein
MMSDNNMKCGCEIGRDCTKTTMCQAQSAVEDYVERLDIAIVALERLADPAAMCNPMDQSNEWITRMRFAKNILADVR